MYGSVARGDDDGDSDIDLLVVLNSDHRYGLRTGGRHRLHPVQASRSQCPPSGHYGLFVQS